MNRQAGRARRALFGGESGILCAPANPSICNSRAPFQNPPSAFPEFAPANIPSPSAFPEPAKPVSGISTVSIHADGIEIPDDLRCALVSGKAENWNLCRCNAKTSFRIRLSSAFYFFSLSFRNGDGTRSDRSSPFGEDVNRQRKTKNRPAPAMRPSAMPKDRPAHSAYGHEERGWDALRSFELLWRGRESAAQFKKSVPPRRCLPQPCQRTARRTALTVTKNGDGTVKIPIPILQEGGNSTVPPQSQGLLPTVSLARCSRVASLAIGWR